MSMLRDRLEHHQVLIYFAAVVLGAALAWAVPGTQALEAAINPALALMLFVTFLQVPLAELGRALQQSSQWRFVGALLLANFVLLPLLAALLLQGLPGDTLLRLGVLLVLLAPCIDYVVTFSHLGKADAHLLLAATPVLLLAQMLLLPLYLNLLLGDAVGTLIASGASRQAFVQAFTHAFVWLMALPLLLAALVQQWAKRSPAGERSAATLGLLPVPATALVLLLVVAAVLPQLGAAGDAALRVLPVYIAFAVVAPLLGWLAARLLCLPAAAGRAVAFSAGTRNSLVVLPLALAVPGAMPVLPAIIVTQTLVELVAELFYIRLLPRLGQGEFQKP
ncbi:MAG: arsenic resistance protein [Acidovorax sp.]|nr:arsenic resistance protein [Acidovorax sp.]